MAVDERSNVAIFGAKGFLGRYLVHRIAKTGASMLIVGRSSLVDPSLSLGCAVGQLTFKSLPQTDQELRDILSGVTHVVNLIGIIKEKGRDTFEEVNCNIVRRIARAAQFAGCTRFVHVSALLNGASQTRYGVTKMAGEMAAFQEFPNATVIRPGLIFGAGDKSLNLFVKVVKRMFVIPLIAMGSATVQPVYVGDVAEAIEKCLQLNAHKVCSKVFEVAGVHRYTFAQLFKYIADLLNKRRVFLPLSFKFSLLLGFLSQCLGVAALSVDLVRLLGSDSVLHSRNGLHDLGIEPKGLSMINKYLI